MNKSDTSHIEDRIFSEALATGQTFDLEPEDFSVEEYSLLWRLAQQTKDQFGSFDVDLLATHVLSVSGLDRREWLEQVLSRRLGRPELIPAYVANLKAARHSEAIYETLEHMSFAESTDPVAFRERCLDALNRIQITGRHKPVTMPDGVRSVMEDMDARFTSGGLPGVTTGFPALDTFTGGWHASDLILIGARPAVGKTALMTCMAISAARDGKRVGIVSAEQPATQLIMRMIAQVGGIPAWKLRNPRALSDREWPCVSQASAAVKNLPIEIYDASSPDMASVRVVAKLFQADLIFVDYVQRLRGAGESSYDKVSSIAKGLKELARDMEVPVVALAQINRAGAAGAKMENLKGSGDLEQEADSVLILERVDNAEVATLDAAKNRHGPTGLINLAFRKETMLFEAQA